MSHSPGKWNNIPRYLYPMLPLPPICKRFISLFAEIDETCIELEPVTRPTGSQNDFLAKNLVRADVHQTVHRGAELREQKARSVLTSGKQQRLRIVSEKARGPCDPPNKLTR